MAVEINVLNQQFRPLIRDTGSTPNLVGNIGEVIEAKIKLSLTWASSSKEGDGFKLEEVDPLKARIIRQSGDFYRDGMRKGDQVVWIQSGWDNRFDQTTWTWEGIISFISEDGKIIEIDNLNFLNGNSAIIPAPGATNAGLWAKARESLTIHKSLKYSFGLVENTEEFSNESLQTKGLQNFYVPEMTTDPTDLIPQGIELDWLTGQKDGIYGSAKLLTATDIENAQQYEITHYFVLNPVFLIGQENNFLEGLPPDYLEGEKSLKYTFQAEFRRGLTNLETSKEIVKDNVLGSTGWYNENFNGYNNNYSVFSVAYKDTLTGNIVAGLQTGKSTTLEFEVQKIGASFPASSVGVLYVFKVPTSEEQIENTKTNFYGNFLYDYVQGQDGQGQQIGNSFITNIEVSVNGSGNLAIVADINFASENITETDNFVISFQTENSALDLANSDRVNLLVAYESFVKASEVESLVSLDKFLVYNVNEAIGQDLGNSALDTFNESSLLFEFEFSLDLAKKAFLNNIYFSLIAENNIGESFELDRFQPDLSSIIIDAGSQLIDVEQTRGYELAETDLLNLCKIETGAKVGDSQKYSGTIGQKIKWQNWLKNNQVFKEFFDSSKPQNGLNYKTSNYSGANNFKIYLALNFDLSGLDVLNNQIEGQTKINSGELVVRDYNESLGQTFTGQIETFDSNGQNLNGAILKNENTTIKATYNLVSLSGYSQGDFWGAIRMQETGSQGDNIIEITTGKKPISGLLVPLPGESFLKVEIQGNDLVLSCQTDHAKLANLNYDLSSEFTSKEVDSLFSFVVSNAKEISPVATKTGNPAKWQVFGGAEYNTNTPDINANSGDLVLFFADNESEVTTLNLNNCEIKGAQTVDLSAFTALTEVRLTNQNLNLLVGDFVKQAGVEIYLTNSVFTLDRLSDLIDSIIIANGGTITDNGTSYTGNPGEVHANRVLNIGTLVVDLDINSNKILYEKVQELQNVGWTVNTLLTICGQEFNIETLGFSDENPIVFEVNQISANLAISQIQGSGYIVKLYDTLANAENGTVTGLLASGTFNINNFLTSYTWQGTEALRLETAQQNEPNKARISYDGVPSPAFVCGINQDRNSLVAVKSNSVSGSGQYFKGVLAANNSIYCAPANGSKVGKYDPLINTFSKIGSLTFGAQAFNTILLLGNGLLLGVPKTHTKFILIDPSNDSIAEISSPSFAPGSFAGGIVHSNGNAYLVPYDNNYIVKYDTGLGTLQNVGSSLVSAQKFFSATEGANGRLYFSPFDSGKPYEFDTVTENGTFLGATSFLNANKWEDLVEDANGNFFGLPYEYNRILKIETTTGITSLLNGTVSTIYYRFGVFTNNKIVSVRGNYILVIDTINSTFKEITINPSGFYIRTYLGKNGFVYSISYNGDYLLSFDPFTEVWEEHATGFAPVSASVIWALSDVNNNIVGVPFNNDKFIKIKG